MNITDIRIRKVLTGERLRAVVSVTIDDMLAIHDIKVIEGAERFFVAMPSRREENGVFRDIVHPISGQARHFFEDTVLNAYKEFLETRSQDRAVPQTNTENINTNEHTPDIEESVADE
ncbi:MAG: septation regulator SpoVG [Oscillospiraceae bacterium]|nr:septation regulator SpoVG [Oscillospiraceae bacterium]